MASTSSGPTAGDETNDAAKGDAVKPDAVDDGGSDAAVDPGLVIEPVEKTEKSDADKSGSTNHTGLTPDSIQVD